MSSNNSNANWIFKNGAQAIDCTSFPFAFRTMFNVVRKGVADKKPVNTKDLTILGPKNLRGERTTYSYDKATQLATEQGLLTMDGQINSREFKRR
jgi:hypothetical protein